MIVCSCTQMKCGAGQGCDVRTFLDGKNAERSSQGLGPHGPADAKSLTTALLKHHHEPHGSKPCGSCYRLLNQEVDELLSGGVCAGEPKPQDKEALHVQGE